MGLVVILHGLHIATDFVSAGDGLELNPELLVVVEQLDALLVTKADLLVGKGGGPLTLGLLELAPQVVEASGGGLIGGLELGVVFLADLGANEHVLSQHLLLPLTLLDLLSLLERVILGGELDTVLGVLGEITGVVVVNPGLDPLGELTSLLGVTFLHDTELVLEAKSFLAVSLGLLKVRPVAAHVLDGQAVLGLEIGVFLGRQLLDDDGVLGLQGLEVLALGGLLGALEGLQLLDEGRELLRVLVVKVPGLEVLGLGGSPLVKLGGISCKSWEMNQVRKLKDGKKTETKGREREKAQTEVFLLQSDHLDAEVDVVLPPGLAILELTPGLLQLLPVLLGSEAKVGVVITALGLKGPVGLLELLELGLLGGLVVVAELVDLGIELGELLNSGIVVVPLGEGGGLLLDPGLEGIRLGCCLCF